ncbi:MAG: hypothetical protein K6G49_02685 [Candidatus Saccharibacteria bacterium]|nr:hypothetical protein [Candidatus Saccharibacteria bacterium]
MKKQYMDFVPTRPQIKTTKRVASEKTVKTVKTVKPQVKAEIKTTNKVGFASEDKPKLGAVENLNTRFVRSDVPKRPLSRAAHFTTGRTGIAAAKAQKIGMKSAKPAKSVENSVEKSKPKEAPKTIYQPPKTPFVNQEKVVKRPLSAKNVYPEKKPEVKEAKPEEPVTIIEKPEKQAHAGMVIAIILTIILGAAAGTVAFLLLPK